MPLENLIFFFILFRNLILIVGKTGTICVAHLSLKKSKPFFKKIKWSLHDRKNLKPL